MHGVPLVQIKLYFRHECAERGQALNPTLTAQGRRDKVGKISGIRGKKKSPSNLSASVKTKAALPSTVMLPQSRHFRSCRGGGRALDGGGRPGAVSRAHSATCRPCAATAAPPPGPGRRSPRLCPPAHGKINVHLPAWI